MSQEKKVVAVSISRYNGGAKVKRLHGSSTVTLFEVYFEEHAKDYSKHVKIEAKGANPHVRKQVAIDRFLRENQG